MPDTNAELADGLRVAIFRGARRLRQEGTGISNALLTVLARIDRCGPQTPGALADFENVTPPSMTRTINCLVEEGLVTRTAHPDDGRAVIVELTDAGRDEVITARRKRNAWLQGCLDDLSEEDRATLARAVTLIQEFVR